MTTYAALECRCRLQENLIRSMGQVRKQYIVVPVMMASGALPEWERTMEKEAISARISELESQLRGKADDEDLEELIAATRELEETVRADKLDWTQKLNDLRKECIESSRPAATCKEVGGKKAAMRKRQWTGARREALAVMLLFMLAAATRHWVAQRALTHLESAVAKTEAVEDPWVEKLPKSPVARTAVEEPGAEAAVTEAMQAAVTGKSEKVATEQESEVVKQAIPVRVAPWPAPPLRPTKLPGLRGLTRRANP